MPPSNLVVCQMLCIYFNDSMKVLRYIYFQKNLETLVPVTSLLHLSNLIYGWIKKKTLLHGEVQKHNAHKLLSSCWRPIKFEEI